MRPITVAGHFCLDVTPSLSRGRDDARAAGGGSDYWLQPGALREVGAARVSMGGAVANTGRALLDLGAPVSVALTIGDDTFGEIARSLVDESAFVNASVDVSRAAATSYSIVVEPAGADRTFWHHVGANAAFDGTGLNTMGADILHLGYPTLLPGLLTGSGSPLVALLRRAKEDDVTTSVDLAVYDRASTSAPVDWERVFSAMAPWTDLLTPSLDDLTSALGIDEPYSEPLVDALAGRFLNEGVAVVAISTGRHGLHVRTGSADRLRRGGAALRVVAERWADRAFTIRAVPVERHETTNGAGDASTAGLLYGLACAMELDDAAHLAIACSAAVIGGRRPYPSVLAAANPGLPLLLERPTS